MSAGFADIGCCPVCTRIVIAWRPGPGGSRPRAACPHCGCLERHRFLALLIRAHAGELAAATTVEVAPAAVLQTLLAEASARYVGLDYDPAADGRRVDVVTDLTATGLASGRADLIVCFHVLEHVPDDRAAMAELARLLSPRGVALVQVPWRPSQPTDEDPAADASTRVRRFGQADHVRYYGRDFPERLEAAGLCQRIITAGAVLPPELLYGAAMLAQEPVWIVRRADAKEGPASDPLLGTEPAALRERLSAALAQTWQQAVADHLQRAAKFDARREAEVQRELVGVQRRMAKAEQSATKWEREYRRLRGRWPVRAMAVATQAVRRVTPGRPGGEPASDTTGDTMSEPAGAPARHRVSR